MEKTNKAFDNWAHNAVHLTFPNGNKISTTWGYCTYSVNHDCDDLLASVKFDSFRKSNTVEIMILECPDKLRKKIQKEFDFEDVAGYLSITDWLKVLNLLAK